MAKKKVRLPKDFEQQLLAGDIAALKQIFDKHDVNARGGYGDQTALAFNECPDELARWLVANGADIHAANKYGDTPLHARASHWQGRIDVLLELGANVNHGESSAHGTPLHQARTHTAPLLLDRGARVDATNRDGDTPLTYRLKRCSNTDIEHMAQLAELYLAAGARQTPEMKEQVTRIGTDFEWMRERFNPDSVDQVSAALDRLYQLFDTPPVPRKVRHDGKVPIKAKSAGWQAQHDELWQLLVPATGAAATVQGEVIRITGRISDEMERNGGANWDADYRRMADAFVTLIGSGAPLPDAQLAEARALAEAIKKRNGDTARLAELAVAWVALNPAPMTLPPQAYRR